MPVGLFVLISLSVAGFSVRNEVKDFEEAPSAGCLLLFMIKILFFGCGTFYSLYLPYLAHSGALTRSCENWIGVIFK